MRLWLIKGLIKSTFFSFSVFLLRKGENMGNELHQEDAQVRQIQGSIRQRNIKWKKADNQNWPTMSGDNTSVVRLRIKAAFPFWRVRLSLWNQWFVEVFWSAPEVERASSLPSLAMCFSASACQPPRVSTGSGMKLIRWALHASKADLIFLSQASLRA